MLANADKKLLTLGIHPELQTPKTQKLMPEMEDPMFKPSQQDIEQKQQKLESKIRLII